MHFKMEAEIEKNKFNRSYYCQKWGKHVSKMCKFETVCASCGYDHPSKCHNDYVRLS